jgi:hypothetical protein
MSRDFFLECRTCDPDRAQLIEHNTWGQGYDLNWDGDNLLKLLPRFPLFATIYRAGFEVDVQTLNLRGNAPSGLGAFAAAHEGHDIQVWDEYGSRWLGGETCDETIHCGTCASYTRCLLPRNHEGDHSPLDPKAPDPTAKPRALTMALDTVKVAWGALRANRARRSIDPGDTFDLEDAVARLVTLIKDAP